MSTIPNMAGLNINEASTGAHFDIFQKAAPLGNFATGVYIFAINPDTGQVHVAFGRKVPGGRRVPYWWSNANPGKTVTEAPKKVLSGAAGTKPEFHGKWASLGGGADKTATNPLDAARIEVNDEAGVFPKLQQREIYVPWGKPKFDPTQHRVTLIHADQPTPSHKVFIFVFKWENWEEFYTLFPDVNTLSALRGGQAMVSASHGEIDFVQSFTLDQIVFFHMTSKGQSSGDSNFFTRYTLATFLTNAGQAIARHLKGLTTKGGTPLIGMFNIDDAAATIGSIDADVSARIPDPNGWRDKGAPLYM